MALRRARMIALLAVSFVVLPMTGCGSDSAALESDPASTAKVVPPAFAGKSVEAVLGTSFDAMRDLKSVRIQVDLGQDGVALTGSFDANESECGGFLSVGDGLRVQLVHTATRTFQKGNREYWTQEDDVGPALLRGAVDHWVQSPRIEQLARLCDLESIFEDLEDQLAKGTEDTIVGPVTAVNGVATVELTSSDPEAAGRLRIEAEPPHRVLHVAAGLHSFSFDRFDDPIRVRVPKNAADLMKLVGP